MRFRSPTHLALVFVLMIAPAVGADDALGQPESPSTLSELLRLVPERADVAVGFEGLADARHTVGGRWLVGSLLESDEAQTIAGPWSDLASKLDWTPEQTADRLLGGSVVLALSGGPLAGEAGAPLDWIMISEVAPGTDERLLERLRAAARRFVKDVVVLAIESGRLRVARRAIEDGGRVRLIVGRADSPLFEAAVGSLAAPAGDGVGLAKTDAGGWLADAGKAQIIALAKVRAVGLEAPAEAVGWSRFVGAEMRVTPRGWAGDLVFRDAALAESLRQLPVTSDGPFDVLTQLADVVVLDARPEPSVAEALAALGPDWAPIVSSLGPRQLLIAHAHGDRATIGIAAEVRDPRRLLPTLDAAVPTIVRRFDPGADADAATPDFSGVPATTIRAMGLSRGAMALLGLGAAPGAVRWNIATDTRPAAQGDSGWLIITLDERAAESSRWRRDVSESVRGSSDGGRRERWFSLARMRLSSLPESVRAGVFSGLPVGPWSEGLDSIAWSLRVVEGFGLEGGLRVELLDAKDR